MTPREQLAQEIEQASDALVEEILDFCLFLKQRQSSEQSTATPQAGGILDLLERVKEIQAQFPEEEWYRLPHDGAINHDHYLYGAPKVEE